jgi:hypothetical protein
LRAEIIPLFAFPWLFLRLPEDLADRVRVLMKQPSSKHSKRVKEGNPNTEEQNTQIDVIDVKPKGEINRRNYFI